MSNRPFNLQGHRGARGLRPENTLPSFEVALDAGVTSIETDLQLSRDGVVIVWHDAILDPQKCRGPDVASRPLIAQLTLAQLRHYIADGNPDPSRFPRQQGTITPVAAKFAQDMGIDAYSLLTLDHLFEFARYYAECAAVSPQRRQQAGQVVFDLELKRVPGRPERIGDAWDGKFAGMLEAKVLSCLRRHDLVPRCVIRSFDHRSVLAIKQVEPQLRTAVLIAGTAPVAPEEIALRASAEMYCPEADFLDEIQVQRLHAAGLAVVPWTVNDPADWDRLLKWDVDGLTTDDPDRLAHFLSERARRP